MYNCTCQPGFIMQANGSCTDNECAANAHNCSQFAACIDRPGAGYNCTCYAGYSGNGRTCTFTGAPLIIRGNNNTLFAGNCFPFGISTWVPWVGFIYKNIPPFVIRPGSTLYFDTGLANDYIPCLSIYMNAGSSVSELGRTLVADQRNASGYGDSVIGNYDLAFQITGSFTFSGGALAISFSNPCGNFGRFDTSSCNGYVVENSNADITSYFDHREYRGPNVDTMGIGIFKIQP